MRLELKNVRIEKLRPHEAVVESLVEQLMCDIKMRGLIYPIVVDKNTYTILDGHHRAEAFRRLGLTRIPAILIDYRQDYVTLRRWFYILDIEKAGGSLFSPKVDEVLVKFIRRVVRRLRPGDYEAQLKHWRYITRIFHNNLREFYWILHEATQDLPFRKVPEDQYRSELPAIVTPYLLKQDVIQSSLSGRVFPPKTTRHIFHFEIPEVNYKIRV